MMQYKCLSIAGFDGSGGAGIQADIKTFSATGSYAMTVLTAVPVQNTCGVRSCYDLPVQCIQEQLEAIFDDAPPDAIKIGMLFTKEIIDCVTTFLSQHANEIPIILDPVMVAKSGDRLLQSDAITSLKNQLIPLVDLITPNIPEAQCLVNRDHDEDKINLAHEIFALGCKAVLLKGGHEQSDTSDDYFLSEKTQEILSAPRIDSHNTHGTGCTLSAAITSYVAQGFSLLAACQQAKTYLTGAIQASQSHSVGKGHGPVHHFHQLWKTLPSLRVS